MGHLHENRDLRGHLQVPVCRFLHMSVVSSRRGSCSPVRTRCVLARYRLPISHQQLGGCESHRNGQNQTDQGDQTSVNRSCGHATALLK